jgi:serine protease Do
VTELREYGRVRPGWIGARLQQVTPDLADAFGLIAPSAAVVATVPEGSPAEMAGLRVGDVVTSFADRTPADVRALMRMVAQSPLDSTVTLTVQREGSELKLPITIREYPPAMMVADYPFELPKAPVDAGSLGLSLAPASEATRAQLHLAANGSGAEVVSVAPGSAADRAGLHAGDAIVQVLGSAAATPDDVQDALQNAAARGRTDAALLIADPSGQRWVALSVAKERTH